MKANLKEAAVALALVLTILMLSAAALIVFSPKIKKPACYEPYRVQAGETIWEIATESDGHGRIPTQHIVDLIEKKSECTAHIEPGQIIYVPMWNY